MSVSGFRLRIGVLILLFLGLFILAPATASLANTAWPKFQHDTNNTGLSPYIGSQTNATKWTFSTGGKVMAASPTIGPDGTIYIGSGLATGGLTHGGTFFAINPDGTQKWKYTISNTNYYFYGSSAIGTDGTIYVGSYEAASSKLYAFNPNGTVKWTNSTGNDNWGSPAIGPDGTIYIASDAKKLYAFNPDGTVKWTSSTLSYFDYACPAIGPDGTIYIGNENKNLYAFNPDGTVKWSNSTGGLIEDSPAIGTDGTIYLGNEGDKKVYAFNPNGTVKWSNSTGGAIYGSPAIGTDGTIYIGSTDSIFYAFNPDGTKKWTYPTGGAIRGSPAIGADGTIYIGDYVDKKVYAFNPNGTLEWTYTTGGIIFGSPAIGPDGTVYIGSQDYNLYAFAGTVNFTANQTSGGTPLSVQFTGISTVTPISWYWDFGDGSNSFLQNPSHIYANPGSYTVNLTITTSTGTNYLTQSGYINVYSPPTAAFTANATSGKSPLSVTFTDQSAGAPTSWNWDFGDGTYSTSQNPTHTFTATGSSSTTYTVNLTVTNVAGGNTTSKTNYITLYSTAPIVSFTASPRTSATVPQTVQFNDTSTLSPTSWYWDFGDGGTSTLQNPTHAYTSVGSYTVTLNATNAIGTGSGSQTSYITLLNPTPISTYNNVNLYVSNDEGVKYDIPNGVSDGTYNYVPNTYFQHQVGGFNAPHISTDPSTANKYGQFTTTTNQSGTFWFTFTGGQPTMDDGVLMLAVNGTIPDDFSVHIRSSGYNWTPNPPALFDSGSPTVYDYENGALNETFTKSDFIYGPQTWRPANSAYPIYYGQNMSDTTNTFHIMFIDLRVGAMESGIDGGAIKVEYSFNNLTSLAAFNVYGWFESSNHGTAMMMTNSLGLSPSDVGPSGYSIIGIPAAPVANFTASTTSGWYDLSPIQFTDTSANIPQSWYWDFGDGMYSTSQNPTHIYSSAGTYSAKLTVTNVHGTNTTTQNIILTVPQASIADFTANVTSGTSPLPVQFTDTSTNSPVAWFWDFGDGTNSTVQNPVHWYAPGMYSVNLTVTNGGGSNSLLKSNLITVAPNGLTNQFKNPGFETGDLTGWTAGSAYSISSNYHHSGTYSLYANYAQGDGSLVQYVDLTNIANISYWGYRYSPGVSDGSTGFYDYIDGNLVQTDTWVPNTWTQCVIPTSTYTGVHKITFVYYHTFGYSSYVDDFVAGSASSDGGGGGTSAPVASFTATPVNGKVPLIVKFTDASTGSPTSWLWNFGDGTTSANQNPSHTYTTAGTYDVTLTATNAGGSNSKVKTGLVYVAASTGALPNYNGIYVRAANHDGIRWDTVGNGTYYISPGTASGGLSAIHISTDPSVTGGQITSSQNQSGTFYITANSGVYEDEAILLLGVTGTIPDDFSARITTSGYTGTPPLTYSSSTYQSSALDQTFTKNDFFYGPQNWKPTQGNANYPLYYGQDMSSSKNQYRLMFVDTRAGILSDSSLTNNGAVRVDYSFTDLPGTATFNVYGWRSGQGMQWTNDLTDAAASGYTVSTKTPTVPPVAGFVANQTTGLAPFIARFTDTTNNTPTAWYWTFGDGSTSTSQNPAHTYASTGTYSVSLTASNSAGSDIVTKTGYITVNPSVTIPSVLTLAGVQTQTVNATQNVSIAVTNATASGNTVTVTNIGTNWTSLAITLADPPVTNTSGSTTTLTGTISNVRAVISPMTVPLTTLGSPNVTLTLNLMQLPAPGATITSTISSDPTTSQQSSFTAAATSAGDQIVANAYTVTFTKTGIANVADGGIISSATITMAVSPSWVAANGGTSHIVIMHQTDSGTTTILKTTFAGTDAAGNDLFTAVSPTGLSIFTLTAISPLSSGSSGFSSSSGSGSDSGGSFSSTSFALTASGVGPGQAMNFAVNEGLNGNLNYGISSVSIVPTKTLGSTQLTVGDAGASMASTLTGRQVAGVVQIEPVGVNPSSISQGTITFQLSGAWMTAHSLTPADIVLLRDVNGQWIELPTTFSTQSGTTYTFTATTPGFSYFAIAGRLSSAAAAVTTTSALQSSVTGAATPAVPTTPFLYPATPRQTTAVPAAMQPVTSKVAATAPASGKGPSSLFLIAAGIAGIVLIAAGGLLVRRWWIRRQNPALFRKYD